MEYCQYAHAATGRHNLVAHFRSALTLGHYDGLLRRCPFGACPVQVTPNDAFKTTPHRAHIHGRTVAILHARAAGLLRLEPMDVTRFSQTYPSQ